MIPAYYRRWYVSVYREVHASITTGILLPESDGQTTLWPAVDKPIWGCIWGWFGPLPATGQLMLQQPYAGTATASCSTTQEGVYPGIAATPGNTPILAILPLDQAGGWVAPGGSGRNTPYFDPI